MQIFIVVKLIHLDLNERINYYTSCTSSGCHRCAYKDNKIDMSTIDFDAEIVIDLKIISKNKQITLTSDEIKFYTSKNI